MNILLVGSGGREHALAWKMAQSPLCGQLFIAPGNAGTAAVGQNVPLSVTDFEGMKAFCLEHQIEMVVVGPEEPLVRGIYDFFKQDQALQHIGVVAPSQYGAQLEGSKAFAKAFMAKQNIPTAAYKEVDNVADGVAFLKTMTPPYVLKADGLAAGKGVLIINELDTAVAELTAMLDGKFGAASRKVVIEAFLSGIEFSVFVLTDGDGYKILPEAKDYKRIGEGDMGLNTGGMGAVSPVPFVDAEMWEKVETRIIKPTIAQLKAENIDYKGFIFFGLINVGGEPFVIEYNARMGDPETEAVIPRLKSDLVALFQALCQGRLSDVHLETDVRTATTIVLTAGGYPEAYEKGHAISGLDEAGQALVFHAGTVQKEADILTNGGRVLAITAFGNDIPEALAVANAAAAQVVFKDKYYRKDIGLDLLKEL